MDSNKIDIYFVDNVVNKENAASITKFVSSGGGLILAEEGSKWSSNAENTAFATKFPANWVAGHLGIIIGGLPAKVTTYKSDEAKAIKTVPALERNLLHALPTLKNSRKSSSEGYRIALNTLIRSGQYLIAKDTFGQKLFNEILNAAKNTYEGTKDSAAFCGISYLFYPVFLAQKTVKKGDLRKSPDVAKFPYNVGRRAKRVTKKVTIKATTGDYPAKFYLSQAVRWIWRATGLYAAAADVVRISLPKSLIGKAKVRNFHILYIQLYTMTLRDYIHGTVDIG